jgi:hypothetical protein
LSIAAAEGQPERVAGIRRLRVGPAIVNRYHSKIAKCLPLTHGQSPSRGKPGGRQIT